MRMFAQKLFNQKGRMGILARAFAGSAGLRIIGMGFSFLVGIQLARGLGVDGYGVYGLAMSIIALLTVPTEFGLPQLLTREIASDQIKNELRHARGMLWWATKISLLFAAAIGLIVVILLLFADELFKLVGSTLLAGIVLIALVAMLSLRSAALRGAQKIVSGQIAEVAIRPALHSALLFFATVFLAVLTPEMAMWLGVLAAAGALWVADVQFRRLVPLSRKTIFETRTTRGWWRSALPMAMTEGMRVLQAHALIYFLGALVAIAQVGLYRMATSTLVMVAMPLSLFNIVSMPMIANLHSSGEYVQLQRLASWVSIGMTAGVVILALPFYIAGGWLLGHIYGYEFSAGSSVLQMLCFSAIINAMFGINAALLNMTGNQDCVTKASIFAFVTLASSAPFFINYYGIYGAALANLISVIVWNVLMWRDCRKMLGIDPAIWCVMLRNNKEAN